MVTPTSLFRLSAAAAIAAGLLRILASFPLLDDHTALEWLYTVIDVLLLFGLIGIYLARAPSLGLLGLASFGLAVAALSFIGGPDADPFGFSTYQEGATVLAIAMVALPSRGCVPASAPSARRSAGSEASLRPGFWQGFQNRCRVTG